MTQHLEDDAELYALGLTEPERSAEIEAHLAICAACCERVAAAESVAASLAATLPPMPAAEPRRRAWWAELATVAAVASFATTVLEANFLHGESSRMQRTDIALSALASSHFGHTTLTSATGVTAKAIYSRDGAWAYVIASGAPSGSHVALQRGTAQRDLGALDDGAPATLFIHQPGRGDEYDIIAGGKTIAHGKPVY